MNFQSEKVVIVFVFRFQETIAKNRYWPVEILRLPLPSQGKGKGKVIYKLYWFLKFYFENYTY